MLKKIYLSVMLSLVSPIVLASPFTNLSPTGTNVSTSGASTIGGIVIELVGSSGSRSLSQIAASTLFEGFAPNNPLNIGSQGGFTSSILNPLGGGLSSASFRFTLDDGDTSAGNFDFNLNTLLVNSVDAGNWSDVQTQTTSSAGVASSANLDFGFNNNQLDTGWFHVTDAGVLASLFASLVATETLSFQIDDVDPGDNFYDFTQGIDNELANVGSGPVVLPPVNAVPVPAALPLMASALALFGFVSRRKSL